jgi:hypothetical protein
MGLPAPRRFPANNWPGRNDGEGKNLAQGELVSSTFPFSHTHSTYEVISASGRHESTRFRPQLTAVRILISCSLPDDWVLYQ